MLAGIDSPCAERGSLFTKLRAGIAWRHQLIAQPAKPRFTETRAERGAERSKSGDHGFERGAMVLSMPAVAAKPRCGVIG